MHELIVSCARTYLGTRFQHQGRLKKTLHSQGGIDCLGLLVGVASELDLTGKNGCKLAGFDEGGYSHQPDTAELRRRLESLLWPAGAPYQPGDIALFKIDGLAQHMGIISLLPSPLEGEGGAKRRERGGCYVNHTSSHPPPNPPPQGGRALGLIHAYAPARKVVEHALDDYWREKIVAIYRGYPCRY